MLIKSNCRPCDGTTTNKRVVVFYTIPEYCFLIGWLEPTLSRTQPITEKYFKYNAWMLLSIDWLRKQLIRENNSKCGILILRGNQRLCKDYIHNNNVSGRLYIDKWKYCHLCLKLEFSSKLVLPPKSIWIEESSNTGQRWGRMGTLRRRRVSLETRIETPKPHEIGFSLLPHVLGPKYERRQRPRNSQKSSGQGGAGETWQWRPTWPLSPPWITLVVLRVTPLTCHTPS